MAAKNQTKSASPERVDGVKLRHETLKTITTLATGSLVILISFKNAYGAAFIITNWLKAAAIMLGFSLGCAILAMHYYANIMCKRPESLWEYFSKQSMKVGPVYAEYTYRLAGGLFVSAIGCLFIWAGQLVERTQ